MYSNTSWGSGEGGVSRVLPWYPGMYTSQGLNRGLYIDMYTSQVRGLPRYVHSQGA